MFEIRTFGVTSPSFHNLKTPRHISAISASSSSSVTSHRLRRHDAVNLQSPHVSVFGY